MTLGIREAISLTGWTVCTLALWKGGSAERWGAAFIIASWGFIFAMQAMAGDRGLSLTLVALPALASDVALASGFLWLALRYSSLWLAAAMMLQAIELALYGQFLAGGGGHRNAYALASNVESGLLLLAILGGTLTSWSRRVAARKAQAARIPDAEPAPPIGASYPRIMSTS